jgi:Tfp pilus assembly protein PilF
VKGVTLSRDDLIDACWGGRAISDDAISRVISRLRGLGKAFGSFQVETIPKIGYRLVANSDAGVGASVDSQRRGIMVAGGAIVALGVGGFGYWALRPEAISPQAEILIQKGLATLQNNDIFDDQDTGSVVQAVALLTEAATLAPNSPTPWGALAVAYAYLRRNSDLPERKGYELRSRAAAKNALALDPTEYRALAALRLLEPIYRNWSEAERGSRETLRKNPKRTILLALHSDFLGNVGRWKEAATYTKQIDRQRYQIPGGYWRLVVDLWCSGELQAADNALADAIRQWPQNPMVWRTRATYLMYSGRPGEALTMLRDSAVRPL